MAKAPKKAKSTSKVTSGKDKALMQVIRDCAENTWCADTMVITDKLITYQKPPENVTYDSLHRELVNPEAVCLLVEVKL